MRKLKRIGFFRELEHGDPEGPSLVASCRDSQRPIEADIVAYLKEGCLLVGTPGVTTNFFSSEQVVGSPDILTDGIWAWPSDLAFYLETYHVELPNEFVEHVNRNSFCVPQALDVSEVEL